MQLLDVHAIYAYNRWANHRILVAAESLTSEQLTRAVPSSFPSIHATLSHLLNAERYWLGRWSDGASASVSVGGWSNIAELRSLWSITETECDLFLSTLSEDDLSRIVHHVDDRGKPCDYMLARTLYHVVNHATYHRGQIVTMFYEVGARSCSTDYTDYLDETT